MSHRPSGTATCSQSHIRPTVILLHPCKLGAHLCRTVKFALSLLHKCKLCTRLCDSRHVLAAGVAVFTGVGKTLQQLNCNTCKPRTLVLHNSKLRALALHICKLRTLLCNTKHAPAVGVGVLFTDASETWQQLCCTHVSCAHLSVLLCGQNGPRRFQSIHFCSHALSMCNVRYCCTTLCVKQWTCTTAGEAVFTEVSDTLQKLCCTLATCAHLSCTSAGCAHV